MADVYPVDYSTPVGRIRKYIPDVTLLEDPQDPVAEPSFIFSDEEIQSFVDDETNDGARELTSIRARRAAAYAMIALANDVNLVLKKLVTEDLETDGPAVADKLIKAANELLRRAREDEIDASAEEIFLAVDYVHTPPRYDWR